VAEPFKSFRYAEVISIADSILDQDSLFSHSDLMEIYRMKAISHFSLGEEIYAKNCFNEILKNDPRFKLDPVQNSPKIITFFNQIKLDYLQNQITNNETTSYGQTNELLKTNTTLYSQKSMKSAVIKSILLPGWGHFQIERKKSGTLLVIASVLTLPPAVYYSYETYNREKDYLNEINSIDIEKKYNRYNESFKLRNGFLAAYAVIWLYSQWDLFSADKEVQPVEIQPGISTSIQGESVIITSIKLHF